jgi:hypothetical protein
MLEGERQGAVGAVGAEEAREAGARAQQLEKEEVGWGGWGGGGLEQASCEYFGDQCVCASEARRSSLGVAGRRDCWGRCSMLLGREVSSEDRVQALNAQALNTAMHSSIAVDENLGTLGTLPREPWVHSPENLGYTPQREQSKVHEASALSAARFPIRLLSISLPN